MRPGQARGVRQAGDLRRRRGLGQSAALAAEAEQAVAAGGQGEARQLQGVDLLLGQFRGQLRVDPDRRRVAVANAGVGQGLAGADVLVEGADHAVVEGLVSLEVDLATGLDGGGEGLVAVHHLAAGGQPSPRSRQ